MLRFAKIPRSGDLSGVAQEEVVLSATPGDHRLDRFDVLEGVSRGWCFLKVVYFMDPRQDIEIGEARSL